MRLISNIKERWFRAVMIVLLTALGTYSCRVHAQPFKGGESEGFETSPDFCYNQCSTTRNYLCLEEIDQSAQGSDILMATEN